MWWFQNNNFYVRKHFQQTQGSCSKEQQKHANDGLTKKGRTFCIFIHRKWYVNTCILWMSCHKCYPMFITSFNKCLLHNCVLVVNINKTQKPVFTNYLYFVLLQAFRFQLKLKKTAIIKFTRKNCIHQSL